jgi:hypothetical protein
VAQTSLSAIHPVPAIIYSACCDNPLAGAVALEQQHRQRRPDDRRSRVELHPLGGDWYEADCGDGGHIFYTYSTNDPAESSNKGIWRKEGLAAGDYRIYVHIPQKLRRA